ncbi:hypothetical protein Ddye_029526 [Dipteronia dyeriana]|uniref:DUF8040 domain-containing protein n=1 Tax=Dipteronia dyeriana TaxID=168575 RepID=A0AAD9TEL2_9ROSI|nr:hypothetical protein Ddye_029526 [Dipteronia dyeriana]
MTSYCLIKSLELRLKANDGNVTIEEQIATFINILAHHSKNRSILVRFYRSGEAISQYVHRVLCALLRLEDVLFIKPTLIPDDCTDSWWRWFKGCLGAIDGTYIEVIVPESDKPRYRTRNGHIAINVLGVCTNEMKFVYMSYLARKGQLPILDFFGMQLLDIMD